MDFTVLITLILGALVGGVVVFLVLSQMKSDGQTSSEEMKNAFSSLSFEALEKFNALASETLKNQLEKGEATLEEKKKLIDSNLETVSKTLEELKKQSTALATQLGESQKETGKLRSTAEDLRNVLSSSQARGQWGERMVKDILDLMGLVEHVNYFSQKSMKSRERPDYTFILPKDKKLNMDVKFPLAHYERYVSADSESERENEKKEFMKDVKGHVKDVARRGYIDREEGTVDYVLVFIPNESIYSFLHENDPKLLDFALSQRIVLCSPITLYAVLSLIHQAVESFEMEKSADKVLSILKKFEKQWQLYVGVMKKMGNHIDKAKEEFEELTTTRSRKLDISLKEIEDLKLGQDGNSLIEEISGENKES